MRGCGRHAQASHDELAVHVVRALVFGLLVGPKSWLAWRVGGYGVRAHVSWHHLLDTYMARRMDENDEGFQSCQILNKGLPNFFPNVCHACVHANRGGCCHGALTFYPCIHRRPIGCWFLGAGTRRDLDNSVMGDRLCNR